MLVTSLAQAELVWDLRIGTKGALTGNLWFEPDDAPAGTEPLWGDTQIFVGGGGGLFIEGNLFGYLGLEIDFFFQKNAFFFNHSINGVEYDYYTRFGQFRLPILVKGTYQTESLELSLGVGPEFVQGLSAEVDIDYRTKLTDAQKATADAALAPLYQAEETNGVFLDVDLGINIKVWKLIIPISLRVGFNLDQPKDYDGRIDYQLSGLTITSAKVKAIESYHFALLSGVAYVF
jgi:hypothetical protein